MGRIGHLNAQVSTGNKQTPDCPRPPTELIKRNLLVKTLLNRATRQQHLKIRLEVGVALAHYLADKSIPARIGPVRGEPAGIEVVRDGPGIVDVGHAAKREPVVPILDLVALV